ncbi:MAG: NHL repeat-containing protein [Burkholderiales bacterium]
MLMRAAPPLLAPAGARVVLGSPDIAPLAPAANTLFGPRGVCFADEALVVADTGHHRVLIWQRVPDCDGAPADVVLGQRDFTTEGRNGLSMPTGVAFADGVLAVADAWNHRVLLWHGLPRVSNQPPDVVLGSAERAPGDAPRADTLYWCYGVALHEGRLYVADTGNRRLLVWQHVPSESGAPADGVLGQPSFETREAAELRWPHAIAFARGALLIADAGRNGVLVWRRGEVAPECVVGARDCKSPYGLAMPGDELLVADTANSRLLGYPGLEPDARPCALAGQAGFADWGDNRWQAPTRESLCWPYALAARANTLAVADSGNNRVLLWDRA